MALGSDGIFGVLIVNSGFMYLRPLTVVCVRTYGPYAQSSKEAWQKVFAWLNESGMRRAVGCGFGLMRDDPQTTPPEKCRYEACLELLEGYEHTIPPGFHVMRLPGGAYARQRQQGIDSLGNSIQTLRDDWVPSNGLGFDVGRPVIEIHMDDPAVVPAEERRVDLCVPVAMNALGTQAA